MLFWKKSAEYQNLLKNYAACKDLNHMKFELNWPSGFRGAVEKVDRWAEEGWMMDKQQMPDSLVYY